jgi:hypothetical protein
MLLCGHRRCSHDFLELRRIGVVVLIEIVQFKDSIESRSAIIARSDFGGSHFISLSVHPPARGNFSDQPILPQTMTPTGVAFRYSDQRPDIFSRAASRRHVVRCVMPESLLLHRTFFFSSKICCVALDFHQMNRAQSSAASIPLL